MKEIPIHSRARVLRGSPGSGVPICATGAAHRLGGLAASWTVRFRDRGLYLDLRAIALGRGRKFSASLCHVDIASSTGNIHWLARPHVFGWLLLIGFVLHLEKDSPRLWVIALVSAIWATYTAKLFLAPLTLLIYAASFMLRPLIWTLDKADEWKKARWSPSLGRPLLSRRLRIRMARTFICISFVISPIVS